MSNEKIKGLGGLWEGWIDAARLNLDQIDQRQLEPTERYKDLKALGAVLKKLNKGLYRGKSGIDIGPDGLELILAQLKKRTPPIRYKRRIKILIRGIERGNKEQRWSITPPPSVQMVARDRSPLTSESLLQLNYLYPVIRRFESSIAKTRDLTPSQRIGQILASAVIPARFSESVP